MDLDLSDLGRSQLSRPRLRISNVSSYLDVVNGGWADNLRPALTVKTFFGFVASGYSVESYNKNLRTIKPLSPKIAQTECWSRTQVVLASRRRSRFLRDTPTSLEEKGGGGHSRNFGIQKSG